MVPIVFEDNDILIINKPAGITVNRSDTTIHEVTVQDEVEEYLKLPRTTSETDSDFIKRSGIVHRTDKETSGILLIAKNEESFTALQAQFKERTTKKSYIALVHGKLVPPKGEINVPVGRLPWNRRQFGVVAGGRESRTLYEVEKYYRLGRKNAEILSFVRVYPVTGRTHQIRVHMQYLGYPLFADFLYAGRKTQREDRKLLARVFLHAASLTFHHPRTQEEMTMEAPLPEELAKTVEALEVVEADTV